MLWLRHLCSDGSAYVAAVAHPVRRWDLPCSDGTSHEMSAPPLRWKHFGYTFALAEALLVHFRFGRSTFGALPVQRKHFWCTSGSGKALSVWRKHFRFGGSTSGLEEALLV